MSADSHAVPSLASDTGRRLNGGVTTQRQRALVAYATTQTAQGRAIHWADTAEALQCRVKETSKALQRAVNAGELIKLAGRDGWVAAVPLAPAARRVSLVDLLELARARTTTEGTARRGRRAMHESHEIDTITPGQFADIERLVALIVRATPQCDGDPARIGDGIFGWDAHLHGGRGGWALVEKVRAWAEAAHRAKHEARTARHGVTPIAWTPRLALATVRDYAGACANLLHLAATARLISRSPMAGGGTRGTLYAPCWVPIIERVVRFIGAHADAANPRRRYVGARTLAVVATRLGGRSLRSTDWRAVRDALERARRERTIPRASFEAARYVWRGVVTAMRGRIALPASLDWSLAGDTRVSLVSAETIRISGVIDVAPAARDFSGWTTPDGAAATGLVDSPYGVRAFAAWSTVDALTLRLSETSLPPRAWSRESSVTRPRRAGRAPLQVTATTLESRMRTIARLAGFAARECGVDWTTADLRVLVEPGFLSRYVQWTLALPVDARGSRHSQMRDAIKTMAWIANGFLASQAQRLGERDLVDTLGRWYHLAEKLAADIPTPEHQDWRKVRSSVVAIADAWRGFDGVDGLVKIRTLLGAMEHDLCAAADGRTLQAQRDDILSDTWRPNFTWARILRLMCVVSMSARVPLRGHTVARMTCAMWKASPVRRHQQAAVAHRLPPWEGSIRLELPGSIMKSRRDFTPALIRPEHVSDGSNTEATMQERTFRRDLWELWLMPSGGRDLCRTVHNPVTGARERLDVDFLFPDPVRADVHVRGASAGPRGAAKKGPKQKRSAAMVDGMWSRSALSAAFKRAVIHHANTLNVDVRRMRSTRGALGFHSMRRLFGTHWAASHLVECSRLLDHTSVQLTLRIYVGIDERTMSLVVGAA